MIRAQTVVRVIDNSGGKKAKCIKVRGKLGKSTGNIGDTLLVSIKRLRQRYDKRSKVKMQKSEIHCGVIVQCKKKYSVLDGKKKSFSHNSISIVKPNGKLMSSRLFTILPRELRSLKWSKLSTMAKGYV